MCSSLLFYEQLKVVDAMNNPKSLDGGFRCYELIMVMVVKNKFGFWSQNSRFYEQLRIMDDTSYSSS